MSAPPTLDRSAVVAQRLAEAAVIESEWTAMSYKDRASWWMSAKWYGYQSVEAYRRGDDAQPNESCRYGEPGFFIGTRVAYFEAQSPVEAPAATEAQSPVEAPAAAEAQSPVEAPAPVEATAETPAPVEAPAATPSTEPVAADQTVIKNSVEGAAAVAAAVAQPNTNAPNKKKKKNKRGGSIGAGKTIEISLH
jgi:hypothetical protein